MEPPNMNQPTVIDSLRTLQSPTGCEELQTVCQNLLHASEVGGGFLLWRKQNCYKSV